MNKEIEEFYDKEFKDYKYLSKKKVIEFTERYINKSTNSEERNHPNDEYEETMFRKHVFDVEYNIKHINWKSVAIIILLWQIILPLIMGLIFDDISGWFHIFSYFMMLTFYPILFFYIVFGTKEPKEKIKVKE